MESIQLFPSSSSSSSQTRSKTQSKNNKKRNTKKNQTKTQKVKKGPGLLYQKPLKSRKSIDLFTVNQIEHVNKNPKRYIRYTIRASSSPNLSKIQEGYDESLKTPDNSSEKTIVKKDINILSPSLIKKKVKTNPQKENHSKKSNSPLEKIEIFPSNSKQYSKSPSLTDLQDDIMKIIQNKKGGRKTKKCI